MALTQTERSTLLSAARLTLQTFVKTGRMPEFEVKSPGLLKPGGAFVTLRAFGQIRGCVGDLGGIPGDLSVSGPVEPLYRMVCRLTADAASSDDRCPPIEAEELHNTRIEVAIIGPLCLLRSLDEIVKTGVAIPGDPPAVILPEAAEQAGWTSEGLVAAVCGQAGLAEDAWQQGAPVYYFTTERISEE